MGSKYLKFFVSRLLGTLVDTLVLWIFSFYVFATYAGQYLIAPTISFEIATFFNFAISYYWIWSKRIPAKSTRVFLTRLALFNMSSVVGFLIKMGFLLLFERLFGWDVIYCNLGALLISGIANFSLAEWMVFKKPSHIPILDSYMLSKEKEEEGIMHSEPL